MSNVTILIVDDDETNRMVLAGNIEHAGYKAMQATNGNEAISLMVEHTNDIKLVLLDWMMPELDGMQTLKQIRVSPKLKHLPVIMTTAKDTKADVLQAKEAGIDDYIVKPIDGDVLMSKVRSLLLQGKSKHA